MPVRELIMLFLMCIVWGMHFVVIKTTVGVLAEPLFYAALRMSCVALILSPLLKWHKGQMVKIALAGCCLGAINYALMFSGFQFASASTGAMVMELYVPISMVLAVIFLKERIGLPRITGLIVALAGVMLIVSGQAGDGPGGAAPLLGCLLLVGAMFSEASGAIFVKRIDGVKPLELLGWFALVGAGVLWSGTLLFEQDQFRAFKSETLWQFLPALAYTVFGASLFGHTTYYWLIQRLPVNQVASSTLLATIVAVSGGVFILGEPLTWQFLVGGAMTLAGVGIILIRTTPRQPPASSITPLDN